MLVTSSTDGDARDDDDDGNDDYHDDDDDDKVDWIAMIYNVMSWFTNK